MHHASWQWIAFNVFVVLMLALDLGVLNRKAHEIKIKEALLWSLMWISLAMIFNVGVYYYFGRDSGLKFFTGYIIEKSLSVDNLFVFIMIFTYFKISPRYQHKVLFWGIIGALMMRAMFIFAGIALIRKFHWVIYVFGAFLVITGIRLALGKKGDDDKEEMNFILRVSSKFIHPASGEEESKFFVRHGRFFKPTSLFPVLIVVELSDVIFAVDSIPAIIGITTDPFIVYTSNVFAILGLRSLYFALAGIMRMFYYLNYGLSIILTFVGVKMLIADYFEVPIQAALGFIAIVILSCVLASMIRERNLAKSAEIKPRRPKKKRKKKRQQNGG